MAEEPTKIKIEVIGKNDRIIDNFEAQFNPPEYSINKSAQIAEAKLAGQDSPVPQYARGGHAVISFKLFFDTTEDGTDVRGKTEKLYRLVKADPDLHATPRCRLSWGRSMGGLPSKTDVQETEFIGIATNFTERFVLFKSDGTPLRAEVDITFKEYKDIKQLTKTQQSTDYTKLKTIERGDTISGIAYRMYNDPGKWREIARANNIYNPMELVPGELLVIPPLEELP